MDTSALWHTGIFSRCKGAELPLTPGRSGIAEVGATTLYALFILASIVGIFVVIWRIVMYYFNIAPGIGSSLIIVRREANKRK